MEGGEAARKGGGWYSGPVEGRWDRWIGCVQITGGGRLARGGSRGRQRGLRLRSRTGWSGGLAEGEAGRRRERTFPQATLAEREYSEMAIFSSTMWSAKLSGLPGMRTSASCETRWEGRNAPVSHGADKDDDRVGVGDGGKVLREANGGGVKGEGCKEGG